MSGRDPMQWVWRGVTGVTLAVGWLFILWQNKFHVDVPVVIVALGYLAVLLAITNLWRVGAAAVTPDPAGDEAWSRPLGARSELEREKKALLKAIKDAEFDQAMGKLSKPDAEQLIRMYRARAIEVIKELDRIDAGQAGTTREQIEREVAARVAVAEQTAGKKAKVKDTGAAKDTATQEAAAAEAKPESVANPEATPAQQVEAEPAKAEAKAEATLAQQAEAEPTPAEPKAEATPAQQADAEPATAEAKAELPAQHAEAESATAEAKAEGATS